MIKRILIAVLFAPLLALAQSYPSPTFQNVTVLGTYTGPAPTFTTPLPVASGGTGATTSTGTGSVVLATSPSISNATVTGSFTATGLVTTADLASQAANTVLANATGSSAHATAVSVPSCSGAANALSWTSGTGFSCNSAVNASTMGGATFAAPGAIGSTTASTGAFTNLSASGTVSGAGFSALLGPYAPLASPTFTGTMTLAQTTQAATGQFWASAGARINRGNDRFFIGTATQYDGNQNPSTGDWSMTTYPVTGGQGAFEYLVSNAMMPVGIIGGNLGVTAYGRTSDGSGGGTQATIGMSSFGVNDNAVGGGAALWAYYGSVVRAATSTGSNTNTVELDVANLGATVRQYPNAMYPNGLTDGIGINAGGELQNDSSVTMGTNSAAITISQNDVTGHANWDKGIIFQSTAIAGADGTGAGTGIAIAMAPGHEITWFNNSNQATGGIYSLATTAGASAINQQYLQFNNFGSAFIDGNAATQFQIANGVSSPVNYLTAKAAATGSAPSLTANGSDTNISINLIPKGTGTLQINGSAVKPNLVATSGSVGGSALSAGTCSFVNTTITGANSSMSIAVTPVTYPGDGNYWVGYVSGANTVTVKVCAVVANTPAASAYNIRVIQ